MASQNNPGAPTPPAADPSAKPRDPADKAPADAGKAAPTPNEIMREDQSPRDEQGNRPQSDKPDISG
ncbi:hypothetical protein [Cupriavidus pauculus]|uniref:Uncharacterized protein n=1 Tax=Cupriavidus pauculus TaxID=82633 RepID=A0A3G8H8C9_9BURK|nr:hypothetical protein [Cupriavidus pauculus]AZG16817.1 hypothetical protein EHF44_26000 [Cupriavidus pauculus]